MPENPLQFGVDAGVSRMRAELKTIDSIGASVAPVNRRLMTRREKLMSSLATPARQWTPNQTLFIVNELRRLRGK